MNGVMSLKKIAGDGISLTSGMSCQAEGGLPSSERHVAGETLEGLNVGV